MDSGPRHTDQDQVADLIGFGHVIAGLEGEQVDPRPWLRNRKARKFMGLQEQMAVVAAGRALEDAGLDPKASLGERVGLYMVVGYIPFEARFVAPMVDNAVDEGRFSMEKLSTEGYRAVRPLMTFRCLPNMPAFHISTSFDIQGPYAVTYPGPGQFYEALDQATMALSLGLVDTALVGGVAHQRNFLVEHHFARLDHGPAAGGLLDAAGFMVLTRGAGTAAKGRCLGWEMAYEPHDPFEEEAEPTESLHWEGSDEVTIVGDLGAASLPVSLSRLAGTRDRGKLVHALQTRDMIAATGRWELS